MYLGNYFAKGNQVVDTAYRDKKGRFVFSGKDSLPEGFSKGKVQYAVTRLWADEVTKTEGKVNTYSLRA